jgi:hypothetical protein
MSVSTPACPPYGAALWQKAKRCLDVILHIGAHRCATTGFQVYMRSHSGMLGEAGIGFWGPMRTRSGLFRGIQPGPPAWPGHDPKVRGRGRVQLRCADARGNGVQKLIVSDENMLGSMRANFRVGEFYSGAGERVARYADAFSGYLTDILLNIRSPEYYWSSVLGYRVASGHGVPRPGMIRRLADAPRSWRDVITDVACAAPHARIHVAPFERFAGRPHAQLAAVTGGTPPCGDGAVVNPTPDLPSLRAGLARGEGMLPEGTGRWMPFTDAECARMRETYADDLMWLVAGADGLARLAEDRTQNKAEQHPLSQFKTRGRQHEQRHIEVARPGRERAARQAG